MRPARLLRRDRNDFGRVPNRFDRDRNDFGRVRNDFVDLPRFSGQFRVRVFSLFSSGGLGGRAPQHQGPTETRSGPRLSFMLGDPLLLLELSRAQVAKRRVPTVEVVPALEELEDRPARLLVVL